LNNEIVRTMEFTIPAFINGPHNEIDHLMFKFGNARRRAYSMKWKGIDRLEIIRQLNREVKIPSFYNVTAYDTIKPLPPHIAFGGKKLQELREKGKISREEFHRRRNNILACRGEALKKGNRCLRIIGDKIRVTVGYHQWIWIPIFIPKKYQRYLRDSEAYTVLLKRRTDGRGYNAKITVNREEPQFHEPKRKMAIDINSGHVDFAVINKVDLKPVAFGKVNCPELVYAKKGKKRTQLHILVNKIGNVAKHYDAEVFCGKLKTLHSKGKKRANRKTYGMNQFAMRQIMSYKLPLKGVIYNEWSEGYTTKVGRILSKPLGLDVHKASAYAFAIKVTDYNLFTFLRGACTNEGDGSLSARLNGGSGPTVLHQALCLMHNELHSNGCGEATSQLKVGTGDQESLQCNILQIKI